MSHWHYQLMYHKCDQPVLGEEGYYAVHEYYEMSDGGGWTEEPVSVTGDDINTIKWMLKAILNDLEEYGIEEYN
jgi:hypothetical protein